MREANSILKSMLIACGIVVLLIVAFFGLRLFQLKGDVGQYRTYWDAQARKAPVPNELWYVAFGDSAAQGIGASSPDKGYVGIIAGMLGKNTGSPVHVLNLSVSGAKVADISAQLERMRQQALPSDSVYTLSIGANDMSTYQEAPFREQMDKLMGELPARTVVADIAYFGGGRKRNLEPNVRAANDIIRELVLQHGMSLAPLYETTKAREGFGVHSVDFLHPSDKGYRNWADAFLAGLGYSQ